MQFNSPRLRRSLGLGLLAAGIAACGIRDRVANAGHDGGAAPGDVDQKTSVAVTDQERDAFKVPADSSLTPDQVDHYLRTSLTQFDLIRAEAPALHRQVAEMNERAKSGGVLSGLRNAAEGMNAIAHWGDMVGGSYVRSARTLHYNPAEMEYVRERMGALGLYYMTAQTGNMAAQFRQQAEQLKGQPGSEASVQALLQQAAEIEKNTRPSPALQQNLEALRKARPNVTDPMWQQIGFAGGGMGLVALTGLGDPADTATTRKLNEFRQVYTDALNNRVSPGMEVKPAGTN
jgi:hypothetical protein